MAFLFIFAYFLIDFRYGLVSSVNISGQIFAYVDVNIDRNTDLIVVKNHRQNIYTQISVYKSVKGELDLKFTENLNFVEDPNYSVNFTGYGTIANIAVGDFNGDTFPDLLITAFNTKVSKNAQIDGPYDVSLCWSNGKSFNKCSFNLWQFKEQPILLNCDNDPITDFYAVAIDGTRYCYFGHLTSENFTVMPLFGHPAQRPSYKGAAHGFVDINGDLNADLVLIVSPESKADSLNQLPAFEVWRRTGPRSDWTVNTSHISNPGYPPALQPPHLLDRNDRFSAGHVIFDDLDRDGFMDLLLPICQSHSKISCSTFRLLIWSGRVATWTWIDIDLKQANGDLWTVSSGYQSDSGSSDDHVPIVRSGDYTQNGFPDLLIVLRKVSSDNIVRAYFIENVACPKEKNCSDFGRHFAMNWSPVSPCTAVKTASFFDLNEDGTLDVLFECSRKDKTSYIDFAASAENQGDTTFLKVLCYTATCGNCHNIGSEGSGISLPGASLSYVMVDTEGYNVQAIYTQQSRTSHKSLLLPYALFGLGRTPNFVDKLRLGVPQYPLSNYLWQQIVPNSQMYVVPYPANDPSHWIGRLYVTPSRLILMSVVALGGVCLLICVMIIILHCYEVKQDRKERDMLKKRFHFDAM